MGSARLLVVKTLSLALITVLTASCASDGPPAEPPRYVGPSAPHPLNVEPPRDTVRADDAQIGITVLVPPPSPASPPASAHRSHQAMPRAERGPDTWIDPGAPTPVPVREATAVLVPTRGNRVAGLVRFRDDGQVLQVTASVVGLPAGEHAYHVHVFGDCSSPDAESAGPHFHFAGSSFDEEVPIITGNLGELRPDESSQAVHRVRVRATLQGRFSIVGRSVVVHERGNDPAAPPDGGAGKRLACGVIGVSGPQAAPQATAHHR